MAAVEIAALVIGGLTLLVKTTTARHSSEETKQGVTVLALGNSMEPLDMLVSRSWSCETCYLTAKAHPGDSERSPKSTDPSQSGKTGHYMRFLRLDDRVLSLGGEIGSRLQGSFNMTRGTWASTADLESRSFRLQYKPSLVGSQDAPPDHADGLYGRNTWIDDEHPADDAITFPSIQAGTGKQCLGVSSGAVSWYWTRDSNRPLNHWQTCRRILRPLAIAIIPSVSIRPIMTVSNYKRESPTADFERLAPLYHSRWLPDLPCWAKEPSADVFFAAALTVTMLVTTYFILTKGRRTMQVVVAAVLVTAVLGFRNGMDPSRIVLEAIPWPILLGMILSRLLDAFIVR